MIANTPAESLSTTICDRKGVSTQNWPRDGDDELHDVDDDGRTGGLLKRRKAMVEGGTGLRRTVKGAEVWERAEMYRARLQEHTRDADGQRQRGRTSPFEHQWTTRWRIECVHSYSSATAMTPTAAHRLSVQHGTLPRQVGPLPTPQSCISHSLDEGTRLCGLFSLSIPSTLPTRPPSRHPPFLAHTTHDNGSSRPTFLPPPLSTTGKRLVNTVLPPDIPIVFERPSTPKHRLFRLAPVVLPLLPLNSLIYRIQGCQQHERRNARARPACQHPAMPCNIAGLFFYYNTDAILYLCILHLPVR